MAGRNLHIKCVNWDQVEAFYDRKLRPGNLLSMRVGFDIAVGGELTVALELPNHLIVAIDGVITRTAPVEGGEGRAWIEARLIGITPEVVAKLRGLVADGRAGAASAPAPPATTDLPEEERALFLHLTAELKRIRQLPVHEVLGVASDADPRTVRRGWFLALGRYHPDVVAAHQSAAISHVCEELAIHINRAYERMRASLVRDGRATARGAGLIEPPGWLITFDDVATSDRIPTPTGKEGWVARGTSHTKNPLLRPQRRSTSGDLISAPTAAQARMLLGEGKYCEAKELLAGALVAHPRSVGLRSLYYVSSALAALDDGQMQLATSQLEAALGQDEDCLEAKTLLTQVRAEQVIDREAAMRMFR